MIVYKTCTSGNTFIQVEAAGVEGMRKDDLAVRLCHPREGFSADGVVYFHRTDEGADFSIFNRDGSEAELSGNGMAGLAVVLISMGFEGSAITLSSRIGKRRIRFRQREGNLFGMEVELGVPDFANGRHFPFLKENRSKYELAGIHFHPVSMGNPHVVVLEEDPLSSQVCEERGRKLESASMFPQRTNVEFVFFRSPGECAVFFFERGVGPTPSSGSGSAAVFAVLRRLGKVEDKLVIDAPGGRIAVSGRETIFIDAYVHLLLKADYLFESR